MKERRTARKSASLAGQLLLAHPALGDPHFKRTIVLLSTHDAEGAMGVVLNRPLDRQLGELNAEFALGPLAGVPVHAGGPVAPEQLIIVSWQWLETDSAFQLHFGMDPEQAAEMVGLPGVTLRAFLGYAGWSKGQLENEMRHDTWLAAKAGRESLGQADGVGLWRQILGSIAPELKLLADEPDDPTVN